MKLKNIAKASLALGLTDRDDYNYCSASRTTSTLEVRSQATQDLSEYYNQPFF